MTKTDENIKKSEEFIKQLLLTKFGQAVEGDQLKAAADKLCAALPERKAA